MRHSYTPIFSDTLTSRVWALSHAHLRVWLWLQLQADPEGYVCADVAGVALGARVDGKEAREALGLLALPDADADPDDPSEGRIIERVPKGWRILDFEEKRELARSEGRKARARRYMRAYRADKTYDGWLEQRAANTEALPEDTGSPSVPSDTPPRSKSRPKTKPLPSEGKNPPTPIVVDAEPSEPPVIVPASSRVLHAIPASWLPSESLRSDAAIAGVQKLDERLASLRGGPIGGTRGVFETALEDYVRGFFGKWRTWEETDRAKASSASRKPWEEPAPEPARDLVKGFPRWVRLRHAELVGDLGKLRKLAKQFAQTHHIPPDNLDVNLATQAFEQFLAARHGEAA